MTETERDTARPQGDPATEGEPSVAPSDAPQPQEEPAKPHGDPLAEDDPSSAQPGGGS